MAMAIPLITIGRGTKQTFRVEIDRNRFERLADSLGLFRAEFLESLERAEEDVRAGRTKKLKSLRDLRRK